MLGLCEWKGSSTHRGSSPHSWRPVLWLQGRSTTQLPAGDEVLDLCRRTSSAAHRSPGPRPRRPVLWFQSRSGPELRGIKADAKPDTETVAKTNATKHPVGNQFS